MYVDGVFIGNRLGRDAMAAAAGVIITGHLSRGEKDRARSIFYTAVWMLGGMVRNDGRPKLAMTAMIIGAVSNIVLDYVFMYPLNMGIRGAALATALGPIFSVLILLTLFLGLAEGLQPVFSYFMASGQDERKDGMRRFATAVFLSVGMVGYVVIVLFSEKFFLLFTPDDLELAAFAGSKCAAYFCGFFLAGYNILMISFWQSTARTRNALLISLLRSIVLTPVFILVLPVAFGSEAMWYCQSAGEAVTACAAFLILRCAKLSAVV